MNYSMQQIPLEDRPRERLDKFGAGVLSSAELIAVILGSGIRQRPVLELSKQLIVHFGSLSNLAQATLEEMMEVKGIGRAKAIQLKAACALAVRVAQEQKGASPVITHPKDVYALLEKEIGAEKRENLVAVLLDTKGRLIRHETIAIGTLSNTLVHPREVFYPAIRHKAASLILAHNHPSGDPTPSKNDLLVTEEIKQAGEMIGIPLKDHVIIGKGSYRSLFHLGINVGKR